MTPSHRLYPHRTVHKVWLLIFCSLFIFCSKKRKFGNLFYDFRLTSLLCMNMMNRIKGCLGYFDTQQPKVSSYRAKPYAYNHSSTRGFIVQKINTPWNICIYTLWWDSFMQAVWVNVREWVSSTSFFSVFIEWRVQTINGRFSMSI